MLTVSALCRSLLLISVCLVNSAVAAAPKLPKAITLSYEFIGSTPSVKPLATIFYDPKSLKYSLESWTPPAFDSRDSTTTQPTSSPLLRILLPNGSSTVTSLSTFDTNAKQTIDLWISSEPENTIFSASVTSLTPPPLTEEEEQFRKKVERAKARGKPIPKAPKKEKPKKKSKDKVVITENVDESEDSMVKVNLLPAMAGATPKLISRKPPQVDAAGNEIPAEDEPQEKSFFQKYWWIFLIAAVLTLGGGGGRE